MCSFDTVSIDSDVDTVCTDRVRQHIHRLTGKRPQRLTCVGENSLYLTRFMSHSPQGWHSLIQSVTDMTDNHSTNQSDCDTPTQEEIDPQLTSGKRASACISLCPQ